MNALDILKWAAGASPRLPDLKDLRDERILNLLGIDEEDVIHMLGEHRLIHRFLYRCEEERPIWCTRPLLAGVRHEAEQIGRTFRNQMAAIDEVAANCADPDHPDIIVKGATTYALTQDPRHIHWSNDIDVLPRDPERLQTTLRRLGYADGRPMYASTHELSPMRRGDTFFEIHRFFPVIAYPPEMREAIRAACTSHARWIETSHYARLAGQITYGDLELSSVATDTAGICGMRVANVTMAVLILCAHTFRNYVDRALFARSMRLGELADIADLCRDPRFDPVRFHALAERHGVQDAVTLARHLLRTCLGLDALRAPDATNGGSDASTFPQCLWWWTGIWVTPGTELLRRDMRTIVTAIGADMVAATRGANRRTYGVLAERADEQLPHAIVRAAEEGSLPIVFSAAASKDALSLEACIDGGPPRYHPDRVLVRFGDGFFIQLDVSDDIHGAIGIAMQPSISFEGAAYVLRMAIPWSSLPKRADADGCIPMLLSVTRWYRPRPGTGCLCQCEGISCPDDSMLATVHTIATVLPIVLTIEP